VNSGRGDWIRTSDLPVPNRTLYQAEPRPDVLLAASGMVESVRCSRTEGSRELYLGINAISLHLGNCGGN
jgi:hypothetical protein